MKIEAKDILEYMGVSDLGEDATIDTFKNKFNEQFIRKDRAMDDDDIRTHYVGEQQRKFAQEVKRTAKESGIDLSEDESKLGVSDLVRLLPTKKDEFYTQQIEELKSKSSKPSEQFAELEQKYNALKAKATDYENMTKDLSSKLEEKDNEIVTFKRDYKRNEVVKDIWSKANEFISENASQLEREGFISHINKNYKIDVEDDKPVWLTKEGHRIQDPNKAGEFLDPIAGIRMEAEKNKILKVTDSKKFTPPQPQKKAFSTEGVVNPQRQSRLIRHK